MSDLLGRLGQRAIGERPEAAPADALRVTTDDAFAEVDTQEDRPQSDESPHRPRTKADPARTGEAASTRKARQHETSIDGLAPSPRHRHSQPDTVPETRVVTRRPASDAQGQHHRAPAIERLEKPAPVVPRATSTASEPGGDVAAPGRTTTPAIEPTTDEPVVRPRVEKTLALEAASASATPRRQSDDAADEPDETIVNVHIGRIEVRAPPAPQPASRAQEPRAKVSAPSLASYLAARSRGRG